MSVVRCDECDNNIDLDFNGAEYNETLNVWVCDGCGEGFESKPLTAEEATEELSKIFSEEKP